MIYLNKLKFSSNKFVHQANNEIFSRPINNNNFDCTGKDFEKDRDNPNESSKRSECIHKMMNCICRED